MLTWRSRLRSLLLMTLSGSEQPSVISLTVSNDHYGISFACNAAFNIFCWSHINKHKTSQKNICTGRCHCRKNLGSLDVIIIDRMNTLLLLFNCLFSLGKWYSGEDSILLDHCKRNCHGYSNRILTQWALHAAQGRKLFFWGKVWILVQFYSTK